MHNDPYAKNPDGTPTYTPYVQEERMSNRVWVHVNGEKLLLLATGVLLYKNHNLKKKNAELQKTLKKADVALRQAAEFIEGADYFVRFFCPRKP